MNHTQRILVVDDDRSSRILLQEILESLGYSCELAASGGEALEKLTSEIDLILLDVIMPEMDGFEALRRIRSDPESFEIPVILVTMLDDKDTRLRAIEGGANDFIQKPLDKTELLIRVQSLLKLKEKQDQVKNYRTHLEELVRKRTAELAESRFLYRVVADFTYDWEYWEAPDGRLLFMSSSCRRITGYDAHEFMQDPGLLMRIVHSDDRALVEQHFQRVRQHSINNHRSITFRIICKDGSVAWINHACLRVFSEDGKYHGLRVSNRNCTPEMVLQASLDETRDIARLTMDSLPVAIMYVDAEQRFIFANRTYRSWLGKENDDLKGRTIAQVLGDDYSEIKPYVQGALMGRTVSYERTARHGDGVTRDVKVIIIPNRSPDGQVKGCACLASDTTAAKRHERELLRIRTAVDGATDAIVMATADGDHFYQNQSFSDLFGYEINDLRGPEGPFKAFCDHTIAGKMFETIKGGGRWSGETEMVAKDGRRLHVHVRANAILGEGGDIVSLLGILTDVTKVKAIQATLRRRSAALVAAQKRFLTLFERSQDCIFFKDLALKYTDVNPAMAELFGKPRSTFIGKTDADLFGPDVFGRTSDLERRVLLGQVIENQEIVELRNSSLYWSVLRFPLQMDGHTIQGICGISREIEQPQTGSSPSESPSDEEKYHSKAIRAVLETAQLASNATTTVLLTGETGSGKDYLARYIHENSLKSLGPFLSINCAAIPLELAESELFGHEAGAFTGAVRRKRGLLELAEGGTLLLNEIGDLSPTVQAKLLSFLDDRSFTRVGGERLITVNTRLMAATSRDLLKALDEGNFRRDLYYRLSVLHIHLPPLRERKEDIPLLASELLSRLAEHMGLSQIPQLSSGALEVLMLYSWPGNVRELRNVLERAIMVARGSKIETSHILVMDASNVRPPKQALNGPDEASMHDIIDSAERSAIEAALAKAQGNKERAARLLGISRFTLSRHMKKLGLLGDNAQAPPK